MENLAKIEIGSDEWLEVRRALITATDASIILGVSPWKTPLQLYRDKINGTRSDQSHAMKRGLNMEPEARRAFEELTGEFVRSEFRISNTYEWLAASFDGINGSGTCVEIKCPGEEDHRTACNKEVPKKYMPQVQAQMIVADVDQCWYFSYRPNDIQPIAMIQVRRDEKMCAEILEKGKEFWDRLNSQIPPESCERDVQIKDDRVWIMMEEELFAVTKQIENLEERKEKLRTSMIEKCQGMPSRGFKLKFMPIPTKGSIDYGKIPELNDVNLEVYRKPTTVRWRVDQL